MNKQRHSFSQRYKAFLPPESQDQSIISGHRLIWIGDLLNHLFQYFSIIKNKNNPHHENLSFKLSNHIEQCLR